MMPLSPPSQVEGFCRWLRAEFIEGVTIADGGALLCAKARHIDGQACRGTWARVTIDQFRHRRAAGRTGWGRAGPREAALHRIGAAIVAKGRVTARLTARAV